jgi:hypothetical protein
MAHERGASGESPATGARAFIDLNSSRGTSFR